MAGCQGCTEGAAGKEPKEGQEPQPVGATAKTNTFSFAGLELRCVTIEDQPWFVAADVCRMIGRGNTTMAMRGISPADKSTFTRSECGMAPGADVNAVNESGLYALVLRAQKANPKAREFQNWVTGTVLPAIRKDGMCVAGEEKLDPNNEADLDKLVLTVMTRLQAKLRVLTQPEPRGDASTR